MNHPCTFQEVLEEMRKIDRNGFLMKIVLTSKEIKR